MSIYVKSLLRLLRICQSLYSRLRYYYIALLVFLVQKTKKVYCLNHLFLNKLFIFLSQQTIELDPSKQHISQSFKSYKIMGKNVELPIYRVTVDNINLEFVCNEKLDQAREYKVYLPYL